MKTKEKFDINQFEACIDAVEYYDTKESFEQAWKDCPRGDWMLWIARRLGVDRRNFFLAKALCAKTVIHLMKDERTRKAVEVAEKYGLGHVTETELNAADADAADAADAAYAAYAAAAYAASDAAAAAADAAYAAADAAAADAYAAAAYAAAAAAYAATDAAAAKTKNQKMTADICREVLTVEVFSKIHES